MWCIWRYFDEQYKGRAQFTCHQSRCNQTSVEPLVSLCAYVPLLTCIAADAYLPAPFFPVTSSSTLDSFRVVDRGEPDSRTHLRLSYSARSPDLTSPCAIWCSTSLSSSIICELIYIVVYSPYFVVLLPHDKLEPALVAVYSTFCFTMSLTHQLELFTDVKSSL